MRDDPQRNDGRSASVAAYPGIVQICDRGADIYAPQSGPGRTSGDLRGLPADDQPRDYGVTPLLGKVLREYVPTADELDGQTQYIVDGTLLPCWSWASHPGLYSGKHKATGMNVQVACTLTGRLAWISDAIDGSRHDTYCLSESGVLLTLDPGNWIGDKGYVGNDMLTPIRKPAHRKLLDWEREFNKEVNKIRYVIEQTIANFKTWRIMHTDYRRPLATFTATISTVIALHFYAAS